MGEAGPDRGPFYGALGQHLRNVRKAAGLRPQEVEAITKGKVRIRALQAYENGDRKVEVADLCRLARCYRVSPAALIPPDWDAMIDADG